MNLSSVFVLLLVGSMTASYGFLLEKSTPAGHTAVPSATDYHYFSKQLRDEKLLRYKLEQRVSALEQKPGGQEQDHKMNQLEQNVLKLESRVKFLEENQVVPVNETIDKFARSEIVKESGIYKQKFEELESKYNVLQQTHAATMKTLADFQKKVSSLEQRKGVNQTQMLQSLHSKVQGLETRTHMLVNNGNAIGQDFLALYNKTISIEINAKSMIEKVDKELNKSSVALDSHIHSGLLKLEQRQNSTVSNMSNLESTISEITGEVQALHSNFTKQNLQINELDIRLNQTNAGVLDNIKQVQGLNSNLTKQNIQMDELDHRLNQTTADVWDNSRQVAVTSCLRSNTQYSTGDIIKFSNVTMSSGVSNISAFKSTGKFTCEYPGLYHVTVTLNTYSGDRVSGDIMKNNMQYVGFYDEYSRGEHSSSSAATLILDTNDTMYIKSYGSFYLYEGYSCMSITKIK